MLNRRTFIKQAGVLTAVAAAGTAFSFRSPYKLGLQLFTIREAMEKDVAGTLKKIAAMGYQETEIYGFQNKKYYGLESKTFKRLLDDCNITSVSGHYNLDKYLLPESSKDDLMRYVDECIEGAHVLKQDYIVWPWLNPSTRTLEHFKKLTGILNTIGEPIRKANLQLGYHNHDFEFVDWGGTTGYDVILAETDPNLVKLELDLYWAVRSSQKPHDLFSRQPGRFPIWHVKDMNKANPDLHEVVGDGSIDFKAIWADAALSGLKHIFVEQGNNYVPDALDCVARSATYVKRNLLN